jgi:DNA-binding beta-propeller fold protein YncE
LLQTVQAGPGASGVDISPDGKLVLVASTADDAITLFSLANKRLTRINQAILEKGSGSTDVMFLKDGKTALAVGRMNFRMMLLSVSPSGVTDTGKTFDSGRAPYGGTITRDGKYLLNTNLNGAWPEDSNSRTPPAASRGRGGGGSTIALVELATGRIAAQVVTQGTVTEHVMLSADGRMAAVILANGSGNLIRSSPNFATVTGTLEIFAVGDGTLTSIATAKLGHWPQGGAISRDGKTILVQNGYEREIAVYRLNGHSLTQDVAATIKMGPRPGAIASALSR